MVVRGIVVVGVMATLIAGVGRAAAADTAVDNAVDTVASHEHIVAFPFDLSDVHLLQGSPFKHAQDLDAAYLLSLDPDRLLHNFRVNAGLPSSAVPLGGWESPTCELRGHFVGHYLSACSMMFQSTSDPRFKQRVDYLVAELGKCQQSLGNGYLSAFPTSWFDRLEAGKRVWAPYYTIHKIMAGLMDAYHDTGNAAALPMAQHMADYFAGRLAKLSPTQIDNMFRTTPGGPGNEFGGMSEVVHNLYATTGDPRYLKLADTFDRHWLIDPLAAGRDILPGLHANTHIPQVDGFAWHYLLTGDEQDRLAAEHFWQIVVGHHSFVTGSNSFNEHFKKPDIEASQLMPTTAETCNTYNMLKLTRHLFEWDPKPQYADYYERALYNHILPSIDPDSGMMTYFLSLLPGHFRVFCTPTESFWCCTGTGVENHSKYADSIYFHDQGKTLWVNLFIPSQLHWAEAGLTLRQETHFPQDDSTRLTLHLDSPRQLALKLRVPYWADHGFVVKINGQPQPQQAEPSSYCTIDRQWRDGDVVDITMPMSLHLHRAADLPNSVAVLYGPLVLAGELGRADFPADDHVADQNALNHTSNPHVPPLAPANGDLASWIKPVADAPLTFDLVGAGQSAGGIQLAPLYLVGHQRYTVYWKMDMPAAPLAP